MPNLSWHDYLNILSFVAAIAGLLLLLQPRQKKVDEIVETEQSLLKMTFAYWMVYCTAIGLQKIVLPDWDILQVNLRLTAIFSYFLTFSCLLCLPLHRLSSRQVV